MSKSPIARHEGQLRVWRDPSRFKALVCGRRWGKTFLAVEMLLKASDRRRSVNVYVAPTRLQAKELVWDALKTRFVQLGWRCRPNESELRIKRPNGAQIILKTAERPDRIRGLGIDFIVFDEVGEYKSSDIWTQVVRPALSDKGGSAVFMGTPKGFNFFYDIYNDAKTRENWSAFTFKTIDSPFFKTKAGLEELEWAKRDLSEKDYRQEYEASFEAHSGRIYYAFDREKNNIEYDYNPDLPIIVGQDFNRSPMASALFQKVGDTLIQFDELWLATGDTEQTCRALKERYRNAKVRFRPDATGVRKTSNSTYSDFDIIRKHFGHNAIQSKGGNPRKVDRWAATNRAYEKGWVRTVVKRCKHTVDDREKMIYKEGVCDVNLTDPFMGHMADAADYAIYREFPIINKRTSKYIQL